LWAQAHPRTKGCEAAKILPALSSRSQRPGTSPCGDV